MLKSCRRFGVLPVSGNWQPSWLITGTYCDVCCVNYQKNYSILPPRQVDISYGFCSFQLKCFSSLISCRWVCMFLYRSSRVYVCNTVLVYIVPSHVCIVYCVQWLYVSYIHSVGFITVYWFALGFYRIVYVT